MSRIAQEMPGSTAIRAEARHVSGAARTTSIQRIAALWVAGGRRQSGSIVGSHDDFITVV
jgi:hypothetical protein